MREIKFRAWVKDEKKMLKNFSIFSFDRFGIRTVSEPCKMWGMKEHNQNNIIIMQYIGLKDKNGKEIYEGDILQFERCIDFYENKNNRGYNDITN